MRETVDIPLDSYRLAQYTRQVACYVCDGPNTHDADLCRHCFAPMALAHGSQAMKIAPRLIAVVGASGAGKTVYLGMLMDMLSRQTAPFHALARGAFSINVQQATAGALSQCEFPEQTIDSAEHWNWIHCVATSQSRRTSTELIMPDMAGGAILREIEHPRTFPVVRALLSKASGLMLMVDAAQLEEGKREQEHQAMKLLTFLLDLQPDVRKGWPARPVAVIYTKADQSELCSEDPSRFARTHAPALAKLAAEKFRVVSYFAASVAGACAYRLSLSGQRRRIPLRIEPRGVLEPFQWIYETLK